MIDAHSQPLHLKGSSKSLGHQPERREVGVVLRRHLQIGLVIFVSVFSPCTVSLACSVSAALASSTDPGFTGAGLNIQVTGGYGNAAFIEFYRNGQFWFRRSVGGVGPLNHFQSLQCPLWGEYTWSVVGSCSEPDGTVVQPSVRTTGAYSVPLQTPMDTFSAEVLNPPLANGNVKITYTFPGSAGTNRSIRITPGGQQLIAGQLSGSWVLPLVPGDYTMTAQWCSLGTAGSQRGQAETFKVPRPPPPAHFSFAATTTGRVLTHKYRTDDTYPSPLQTEDGRIRVDGLVHDQVGTGVAGRKVYFRLVDPPDTADYVVNNGDAKVDDNVDGPGTLNGGSTAIATSDTNGKVSVTLGITDHVAGDNYQVEASLDPDFSCSTAPCRRSIIYAAWKRVYVEMNKMYRRGAFLTKKVNPGAKILEVSDVRPFPSPPFDLVLVHGPAPGSGTSTFYSEVVRIVNKTPVPFFNFGPFPGKLELDPAPAVPGVSGSYDGPAGRDSDGNPRDFLADAVAYVTGNRTKDFYLVSGRLVNAAFENAFVEHVWLTDAGTADPDLLPGQPRLSHDGVTPYVELMNQTNRWQREWMTRKWSHHVGRSGKP